MKIKNCLFLLVILFLFQACQYFDTKRITSETFVEDEIKSINWKDVDQYPVFSNCESISEKKQQKECFETTLTSQLYHSINSENTLVTSDLNESLTIDFLVDEKGQLLITSMVIDSLLKDQIPSLEANILRVMDSLQPIAPAYKRGIPVKTTFKLPLVIKSTSN